MEFKDFHPVVILIFFSAVIVFSMTVRDPICLFISFLMSAIFALITERGKALKFNLGFILPVMVITSILNPVFNHRGSTILAYLPWGNPVTAESLAYGVAAALMIGSSVNWFFCFNTFMDRDKIMYIFGRVAPFFSLLFSMILRFVPLCGKRRKEAYAAYSLIYGKEKKMNREARAYLVTAAQSLERAVDTADSMKCRGYGIKKRNPVNLFKFEGKDAVCIAILSVSVMAVLYFMADKTLKFVYFPSITATEVSLRKIFAYTVYLLVFSFPVILQIRGNIKWKKL